MLQRSLVIAAVVGTLLAVINHGDRLLAGDLNARMVAKIILTYCVPFAVATLGALANSRAPHEDREAFRD